MGSSSFMQVRRKTIISRMSSKFGSIRPHTAELAQGSHRPGKVLEFDLGPGKLLEFQNSAICPGIVLEFCKIVLENVKLSLKIVNASILFHSFGFM